MIGVILMVAGFIIGNACGYFLSNPSVMKNEDGTASKTKQTQFAVAITISALMIIVGQFLWSSGHSY
jgi:hypothetical protein